MEWIVSLEKRGLFICRIASLFLLHRQKRSKSGTRVISTTLRRELSSSFFFLQGKAPKEIHAILIETLGKHASSYAAVKNWVTQFKRGDFSTCDAPRPGQSKTVTTQRLLITFTNQSWKSDAFRLNK